MSERQETIVLPLPPSRLGPNGTRDRMERSRLTKVERQRAWAHARQAFGPEPAPEGARATLLATYVLAPGCRGLGFIPRDDDNAQAALKAYRDGIADALGMDDSRMRSETRIVRGKDATGRPRVEIRVTIAAEGPSLEGGG